MRKGQDKEVTIVRVEDGSGGAVGVGLGVGVGDVGADDVVAFERVGEEDAIATRRRSRGWRGCWSQMRDGEEEVEEERKEMKIHGRGEGYW